MLHRTRPLLLLLLAVGLLSLPASPASADEPTLTLTANKSVYVYGQTATLTTVVHAQNLTFDLAVQYPGSSEWKPLGYGGNVNDDTFTDQLGAYYTAQVRARLIDQKNTSDTSDDVLMKSETITVPVKASLGTYPAGYFTRSGSYAVMSKYSAKFVSQSAPAFPGKRCLRHQVQRRYASGWRVVKTTACVLEGTQGRVKFQWTGSHPSNVRFRVRATFAGDAVNRANAGAWFYFRFR